MKCTYTLGIFLYHPYVYSASINEKTLLLKAHLYIYAIYFNTKYSNLLAYMSVYISKYKRATFFIIMFPVLIYCVYTHI